MAVASEAAESLAAAESLTEEASMAAEPSAAQAFMVAEDISTTLRAARRANSDSS